MLDLHPTTIVDVDGRVIAVQLSMAEFRDLVLSAFASGRLSEAAATGCLGVSRPEWYALVAAAGLSNCTYTCESIATETRHI